MTSNTTVQIWNGAINALVQTVIGLTLLCSTGSSARSDDATQTLVFIRHGEKPDEGLGQLSCQGLNRALALPPVIAKSFGRPDYIYAPDPSVSKKDAGELYDYVRPLATVEPTAIFFTLPVDTSFGFSDIIDLQAALEKRLSARRDTLILIAWEHKPRTRPARPHERSRRRASRHHHNEVCVIAGLPAQTVIRYND